MSKKEKKSITTIQPVSRYFSDKEDFVPTCEHGIPFDSVCGECIEDAQIVKAGKERICKEKLDSSSTQIGGNHYKKLSIQPMTYSMENKLDALQHTIIKYVTRFRDKNGVEDLEKAKHCIDMLIDWEKK